MERPTPKNRNRKMKDGKLSGFFLLLVFTLLVIFACNGSDSGNGSTDQDGDGIIDTTDIDDDNDGLIELHDLDMLNNIRFDVTGTRYRTSFDEEEALLALPQPCLPIVRGEALLPTFAAMS